MANDKRYELWNNLSKKGNFGTYEEFDAALDNPKNLRAAYDLVSSDGDVGSFDDWSSSVKRDAPQSSSPAPSSTPSPVKTAGVDTAPPMGDSAPQLTGKLPSTEESGSNTPEVPTDPATLSPPPREQGASKEIYDANVLALRAFQNEWDDALSRYDTLSSGTVGADGSHVDPFDWSSDSDQKYVATYAAGLREYSDASKYNTDDLQQAFIRIMRSPNYRSDKERAAAVLPIVEELNARRNGGHAKTLGERYAEDYLATRPDLRSAYEKWQKGDEPGYISDADKVPVLREGYDADGNWYVVKGEDDTPVTKIANRIVSNIEDKISELIAEKRNPSLGKSLLQNSRPGDMFAESFDDAVEFAKAYNVTDALKEELGKYSPTDWESYIAGYAAKNDMDIDSARNRVISLIVESAVNRLSEKTAPEGSIDYTIRKVVGDLFVSNAVKASIALSAYRPGDIGIFHIDEQGMEQAIKSGRVGAATQVVAELSKFAIDAKMLGFRLAELAGRGGSSLALRALGGFTKAGGRSALRSGVKRAASEIVGSSLNFGTYMTYTEGLRQLRMGDYSWSELGKSGLKGLKEGAVLGVVSKSFDGLFNNSTGWMVPIGETMKFLGEGATFATFGYLDTGKLTAQDIGSSFGMALMARVGHGGQLLRDIRNRMENREDYGKKVTVHKISADEANSLREGGYPTIASALRGGAVTKFDLDALESELDAMRKDTNVPWETVRMADYVFNGKVAPLPLMLGVNVKPDGDRFVITPTDGKKRALGGAVVVDSPSAAVTVFNNLMDDANRNSIALGEHQCLSSGFQRASGSAVIEWSNSRNLGESPLSVWRVYQNAVKKSVRGEELGEYENEVYTGVNGLLDKQEVPDMVSAYRSRLLSQGIDIDAILSKPSHDRTRQETAAVDDYERFLASEVGDPNLVDDASFSAWAGGRKTNLELSGYKGATAEVAQEESSAPEQPQEPVTQEPVTQEPVVATPLVDGRVADLGDFSELFPGEDFDSLDGEHQSSVLSMLEGERALSHAYAAGRTTEVPEHWEYWKGRDGLKEPGEVVADTAEVEETPTPVQEAMPMKDVDGKQRPDYGAASAEQSHRYIYEEKGYTKEQGDQLVSNTITKKQGVLAEKESALAKAQEAVSRGPEVELSEDTESEWESAQEKLQADLAKAQSERDAAAADLAKWERIRAIESERDAVVAEEMVAEPTPTEEVQPTEEVEPIEEVQDVQDEGGESGEGKALNRDNNDYIVSHARELAKEMADMAITEPENIAGWNGMSQQEKRETLEFLLNIHGYSSEQLGRFSQELEEVPDKTETYFVGGKERNRTWRAFSDEQNRVLDALIAEFDVALDEAIADRESRRKESEESEAARRERLNGVNKNLEKVRGAMVKAYEGGDKKAIKEAQSKMDKALERALDAYAAEGLERDAVIENTINSMKKARKRATKGDATHKTISAIIKSLEKMRGVKEGRVDAEGDVPFSLKEEGVAGREAMTGDVRVRLEERLGKEMSDRIEGIAKSLGVKVRFTDEDVNGLMDNEEGVLYIGKDLDADKTEVFVVGHELTHRMQNQSEAKGSGVYSAFKQVALDWAKAHQEEGGNGYDFSLIKGKYERFFRDKYKSEGLRMGMTDEQASTYAEKKVGEKVTDDYVNDEIAANVAGRMMMNPKVVEDMFRVRPADPEKARGWRRALEWLRDFLNERFERIMGKRPESLSAEDRRLVELRNKFNDMYTELVREDLADQGVDTAENGDARYAVKDILEGKERDEAVKDLMRVTGRSEATVKKWLKAEESLASVILSGDNQKFLDLQVDESVPSIWNNSDYPQGTVEFSNICRKRLPFTVIYQRLQEEFPNRVFDASTLEDIRRIMKENGEDVACGLCFVEDRRQLLGEIGDGFIKAVKGGNTDINEKQKKALDKLRESGDKYVPNLYELLTLDGMKKLRKSHPAVAQAFTEYNNARGMQAGRLFQAYSAYHRDIRKWSKAKVESVNDAGGLRIFSFSDFEAHHLIDLVQVISDCASKGVKVQGYTKVPEFAKAVKDTKVKLNRSLIAKDKGFVDENYVPQEGEAVSPNVIDGKRLLLDTVEGIDVNHPDFFDSTDNKNVGNILVGINDEQIRLAMLDPFVDYIIPFHSGLSEALRAKKGIGDWVNYKLIQLEKKYNADGKLVNADKHGINIYTDVLPRGEELIGHPIRTARDFQLAFFKACAERGWEPRFSKFINKNKKGEYVYTPGYEKLLIDFKLFDKRGRLLPQEAVEPRFDNEFNKTILDKYVEGEKSREPYDELYAKVKEGLGLESVGDGEVYSLKEDAFVDDKEMQEAAKEYNETLRLTDRKGEDYYPTPAPLALVASRILGGEGMDILDVGSGDGMLHKFIKNGHVTAVEKSHELAEKNRQNTDANVIEGDFLEMNESKKYPRIILNPPYGNKGVVAFKHLDKAYDALADNGRMVAILPMGKNADQLYDDFVSKVESDGNRVTANVELPSCTFYKAGIHGSRTRMVVVDKGVTGKTQNVDLSGIRTNQGLYDAIHKMGVDADGNVSGVNIPDAKYSLKDDERRPTFYSNAERAVENVKQEKATAEQWKAMLTKAGGIKAGEDKWMGLSAWLDENKGKSLSKADVLQFVRDNGIQMEETHYREGFSDSQAVKMNELQREFNEIKDNIDKYSVEAGKRADEFIDAMNEKYGDDFDKKATPDEQAEWEQLKQEVDRYDVTEHPYDDIAFGVMIERHGDDFDLGFMVVNGQLYPAEDMFGNVGVNDFALEYIGDSGNNEYGIHNTRLDYTTKGLENKREIAFVVPDVEPYQEHDEIHFGPENEGKAVMWVRFGETTDADGNRVLVIDEIQSNRHQDAREKGYSLAPKYQEEYTNLRRAETKAMKDYYARAKEVAEHGGEFNTAYKTDATAKELREKWYKAGEVADEYLEANGGSRNAEAVPAAPFEKNWHEVAMKRMLRLAAEEGFDKVAWTTGEQQAERYSLGRMYDSIEREDNPSIDGKRFVLSGRNMDTFLVNKEGNIEDSSFSEFNGKPLSDVVGKEFAERMMNLEDGDIIEGEQLNIGGEGMKGFYDQMLPRFMDKYGKKWGAKVGEVTLSTPGKEVMHSVDVTPAMKESVMQGQPLFQVGKVAPAEGVRARDYTARTIKKLRSAGVRVQIATREEARRMADVAKRVGAELMTVFHGSGAKFDAFDHSHMGEGEGAQAYGWGTYVTEVEGIGRAYARSSGGRRVFYDGREVDPHSRGTLAEQCYAAVARRVLDGKMTAGEYIADRLAHYDMQLVHLRESGGEQFIDDTEKVRDVFASMDADRFELVEGPAVLYEVEVPDNDGTNYISWDKTLPKAHRRRIAEVVRTLPEELLQRDTHGPNWLRGGFEQLANTIEREQYAGKEITERLRDALGDARAVSEIFSKAGFVGTEYPAQYRSGGRNDGAKNYVFFNEDDAKIVSRTEFLRTSDGTIYGWHDNEGIHLTEDGFNPDTPLHEYTHGFMRMLKDRDPETYDRVVSGLRESRVWREVLEDDAYADIRDDETSVASEVAARLSGRENARRVSTEFDRGGYFSIANAVAVRERVRNALQSFWDRIAEWFGAKFDKAIPADRLARMTLRALDEGVNPDAVSEGDAEFQSVQGVESGAGEQYSLKDAESVRDVVLETIPKLDESNKGDKNARVAAMKAIGGNLSKLRQAMSKQRAYDRETVKKVTDFAKEMIGSGLFSNLEDWEVRRMLTRVKDATGKESIVGELNKLFDLMVNHQLKEGARTFEKILNTKGTKVDSRGIVVAAGLDDRGVRMMNALKESLSLDEASLNDRISSVQDKLGDSSSVVRENAEAEYDGLLVAQRYFDTIKTYQGYETQYKQMLADAKDEHTAGRMSDETYRSYKHEMDEAIRETRLNMVESYGELSEMLGYGVEASKARLKEWRDGQRRRVEEIRHDANRDMQGRDADIHQKPLKGAAKVKGVLTDNLAHKILLNPLGTFENYMRYFGSKFADGSGNLYNRFVRGGIDAQDASWKSYKSSIDTLDAKYRELFGNSSGHAIDMYKVQNSKNRITVKTTSGEYDLNQLSAAYIYCVNKQVDGRMKLRKMGIDEDQVAQIASKVDPRILKYFDWVQSEFLPGMRDRINETHKRVYGASMDNIAGYFPLRVNTLSSHGGRNTQTTLESGNKDLPRVSTSTGGIIKRTVNTLDLDITRVDALQVLLEHVRDMEHWNAYAEYSRDLNTLLGYKRFEAQVKNSMSLRYGDGKGIWDDFVKCAQITTGDYRPKTNKLGENVTKLTSQWAASNIAIRLWTAMKQFQSGIVGATQADWWSLTRNFGKLFNRDTWNWAIENLPLFAERWESRKVGDTTLDALDVQRGGKTRWDRFLSSAARVGITPNAAIDGMTVAILGRSIYETRYKKYRKFGYSEELAKKRALQDAAISVNETQQSSQGMFKSVVQSDRDVLSRIASMYRNASMGYERMAVRGAVSMKNVFSKGWREEAVRVTKDMAMRDGLTAEQAERVAKSAVRREFFRGLANFAMFGSIAPLTWAGFGKLLPLLFTGQNDGDQLKEGLSESLVHGLSGFFEGFIGGATFGDLAEFFFGGTGDDEKKWSDAVRKMGNSDPLMEEFKKAGGKIDSKKWEAYYDIANLFISSQVGVNPKTLVNWFAAGADLFAGDLGELRNWCLFGARLFNMPESATQGVYIKELGLNSDEAKKLSIDEVASRYAHYKRLQGAGYMNLFSPSSYDQDVEDKYRKKFDELLQERLSGMSEEELSRILNEDPREDVKQSVIKSLTKEQGLNYQAPSSGGGEVYERHLVMNDLVEDNAIKSVSKRLSPIKKGWEDLGGSISDKGLMVNEKKSGKEWFDKDKLDAYYAEHKSELDTLLVLHRWQTSFGKYKKQLDEKGADPAAVMERLRAGRKQALKDLGK